MSEVTCCNEERLITDDEHYYLLQDVPLTRELTSQPLADKSDRDKVRDLGLSLTKRLESVSGKIPHPPTSKSAEKTTRSKAGGQALDNFLRSSNTQESGDECGESTLSKTH